MAVSIQTLTNHLSFDDGPQLFPSPAGELPSARFFPKSVVHSVKPYLREPPPESPISDSEDTPGDDDRRNSPSDSEAGSKRSYESRFGSRSEPNVGASNSSGSGGRRKPIGRSGGNDGPSDPKRSNSFRRKSGRGSGVFRTKRSRSSENRGSRRANDSRSEVYDMSLHQDGSYGFR